MKTTRNPKFLLLMTLIVLCTNLITPAVQAHSLNEQGLPLTLHELDIPRQWIELVHHQVDESQLDLPSTARTLAYMMMALYEAALPDLPAGISYTPPSIAIPERDKRYANELGVYETGAVAIAALATVAEKLLVDNLPTTQAGSARNAVRSLRNTQTRLHLQRVDRTVMTRSQALGDAIGNALLDWANDDGFADVDGRTFAIPTGSAAYWQPTQRGIPPVQPYWGTLQPLLLAALTPCTLPLPVTFSRWPGTTLYMQAQEVVEIAQTMTAEQRALAEFWGTIPAQAVTDRHNRTPRGNSATHWLLIASLSAEKLAMRLAEAAALYAPLSLAMHDSLISVWRTSYQTFLLRPQNYINRYIDPQWQPAEAAPNSPSYPSANATLATAAAEVLTSHVGLLDFTDRFGAAGGENTKRLFTTFEAAAYEQAMADLYGGHHFRSDVESGLRQGRCIGRLLSQR